VETNHSTLSKIIGLTWKNLPDEERQIWHARARVALDEHKRKFPSYAFKPVHNKPRGVPGGKRKVREVGPKDHTRCAKIAELLVCGKKGLELEVAIQEFDKNHVPEIITRFEAPITANNYALSSMNNTDKRRLSHPSRHSQAPPSPPSPIDLGREDLHERPSFMQRSLSSPVLSPSFVSYFLPHPFTNKELANTQDQDFNTFPLSHNTPPPSSFESLDPDLSPLQYPYNPHGLVHHPRPSISIPTNFTLADEWAQSVSPISDPTDSLPSTPCQPISESYTPFTLDNQSDYTLDDSYANHSLYPSYSDAHVFGNEYGDVHPNLLSCGFDHKAPTAQGDMDFSTFMVSLPFETLNGSSHI
jgi:hypothetical protein